MHRRFKSGLTNSIYPKLVRRERKRAKKRAKETEFSRLGLEFLVVESPFIKGIVITLPPYFETTS